MNEPDRPCLSPGSKKLFGVALDPADDPWSLQLKQAWMTSDQRGFRGLDACLDPYDALTESLGMSVIQHHIKPAGKFPVPSWLWPKPPAQDLENVTPDAMSRFFKNGELLQLVQKLQSYVTARILPDTPIMIGVDHSATAGVVSALSAKLGADKLGVIVLDQHFDAIPLSVRLAETVRAQSNPMTGMPTVAPMPSGQFADAFCCGNFWAHLIEDGVVRPDHLLFVGVADYPTKTESSEIGDFRNCYLDLQRRGCSFFPRGLFDAEYLGRLTNFLHQNINTPYVYVSLDLDVASYNGTYAARYMDRHGIGRREVLAVADLIANGCREGLYELAGLDVMEFNTHFLGLETPEGVRDDTVGLARDFILTLT
jgi:arginase family enzyme